MRCLSCWAYLSQWLATPRTLSLELPGKQFGPCGLCYYRLHSTLPWTFFLFWFLDLSKTWSGRCWLGLSDQLGRIRYGSIRVYYNTKIRTPHQRVQRHKVHRSGGEVFRIGFYAGLSNLSTVGVSVITQRIINAVSIPVFSAYQVFNRIVQIPNTVVSSISLMSTPIMAQNVGQNFMTE